QELTELPIPANEDSWQRASSGSTRTGVSRRNRPTGVGGLRPSAFGSLRSACSPRILLRNERLCTPPERLPHRGQPASLHGEPGALTTRGDGRGEDNERTRSERSKVRR